jgi:glucosamine-6-phosphate deaminase
MGEADITATQQLLDKIKPHQVFCAGDFADPHGTHKVCFDVVIAALRKIQSGKENWTSDCRFWLYKGAWQEWDIAEIGMAVPMSPDQVNRKRHGIFIHQSQKDSVPFQGSDNREFWQRAEERNANTAALFGQLGLTRYAAMEAFVRYDI